MDPGELSAAGPRAPPPGAPRGRTKAAPRATRRGRTQTFARRANDWAIVGVAAVDGRIALANMGSTPLRASAAEQALADGAGPAEAAELAPPGDEPGEGARA